MAGTRSPVPIVYLDESIGFLVPSFLRPDGSGPSSLRSNLSSLRPGLSSPTYRFITIPTPGRPVMFCGPSFIVSTMQEETTPIFKRLWYDWTQQQPGIKPTNPLGQCWVPPIVAFYDQQGILRTYSLPRGSNRSPHPGSPRGQQCRASCGGHIRHHEDCPSTCGTAGGSQGRHK